MLAPQDLLLLLKTNGTSVAAFRASNAVPAGVPIFAHDFVLENEDEALRLEKPNSELLAPAIEMERVRYNDKSPWPTEADGEGPSLERFAATQYGNDPINWHTVAAGGSPGRPNLFNAGIAIAKNSSWKYHAVGGDLGLPWRDVDYADSGWPGGDGMLVSTQPTVALPTITTNGGTLTGAVQVSIGTVPADANIYYTVNGTDPDESSMPYAASFTVETTTEVRARAYKAGYNESGIASALFVGATPGFLDVSPVLSLSAAGTTGGPFAPPSTSYLLTNAGGLSLTSTGSFYPPVSLVRSTRKANLSPHSLGPALS